MKEETVQKFIWIIAAKIVAIMVVVGLVVYFMMPASAAELKPFKGDTPNLSLKTLAGEQTNLAQFEGKLLMVQFWATYCTPCRVEMPSMNRLQATLGDDFKILAVNMGETIQEVQTFVDEVKPEFTILMDEKAQALADWKVFAAPATFILDKKGKILFTLFGATEWDSDEMVATLQDLIRA